MNKEKAYIHLVQRRKNCRSCDGLINASVHENGHYDSDEIGPWSLWQRNLNASIMVVGQDWGDKAYFSKWKGVDQPSGNPTNENLKELLKTLNINIENPRAVQENKIFLTNLILCLKDGGLQADIEDEWLTNCSESFFKNLVEIVKPRVVLALGKKVSESILHTYGIPFRKSWTMTTLMQNGPFKISDTTHLFPMYHCGASGVNRNRSFADQKTDWQRVVEWLGS